MHLRSETKHESTAPVMGFNKGKSVVRVGVGNIKKIFFPV